MASNTPIISIIVPIYNLEDEVSNALDSILAQQNPPPFEVMVIDDHSTDHSMAVIKNYAEKDKRFKVLTNQRSKGVAGARNTGFDHAQGQWIAFLDGDDTWETDNLASFYEATQHYPLCSIFTSDSYEIIEQDKTRLADSNPDWNRHFKEANQTDTFLVLENPAEIFFKEHPLMRTGSCLIKRKLIDQVGYCDEELKAAVDMSWFFKLAVAVDHIVYVPKPLMNYHHRFGSLTHTIPFGFYGVIAYKKMLRQAEFAPYKHYIKQHIALWSFDVAYHYRRNNDHFKAIKPAIDAVCYDYNKFEYWKNLLACLLLR